MYSHLTAPLVTLYVGEIRIKYRVYEDTLYQLPFFRAALQGQFIEALDKAINMPEDDPEAVAALIQWLYTGKYTYGPNRLQESTMILRAVPKEPSENLLEALFHLEVCVVASKYDCTTLLTEAKIRYYKKQEELDDIDTFRICTALITSDLAGFPLPRPNLTSVALYTKNVKKWVDRLFQEHRAEFYETLSKFPRLGVNLLMVCTHNESNR